MKMHSSKLKDIMDILVKYDSTIELTTDYFNNPILSISDPEYTKFEEIDLTNLLSLGAFIDISNTKKHIISFG